jgi:uncharacterized protein with GYD domain
MPKYVSFFSYTAESWKAMTEKPEDRTAAVKKLAESVGGRIECFYWMSGKYDGFLVSDLPDDQAAGALAAIVKGSGALARYETHLITSMDQAQAMLKKAHEASQAYRPPGR